MLLRSVVLSLSLSLLSLFSSLSLLSLLSLLLLFFSLSVFFTSPNVCFLLELVLFVSQPAADKKKAAAGTQTKIHSFEEIMSYLKT